MMVEVFIASQIHGPLESSNNNRRLRRAEAPASGAAGPRPPAVKHEVGRAAGPDPSA